MHLFRNNLLDKFVHVPRNFHIFAEQIGLIVVAGLDVVEDVREEDYLELVEVEDLGRVEQQLVGVVPGTVLGCFVEDLVGLVCETRHQVLLLQLLVSGSRPHPYSRHLSHRRVYLHCTNTYINYYQSEIK